MIRTPLSLAVLVCCLQACAASAPGARSARASDDAPLRALRYRMDFDAELAELTTELCFEGSPPSALYPGHPDGADYVRWVRARLPAGGERPLGLVDGRMRLGRLPRDACVRYAIDFDVLARGSGPFSGARHGDAVVSRISFWLWRPRTRPPGLQASVRVGLPDGMQLSVPWPRRADGSYELAPSAFAFDGYAVVGVHEVQPIRVGGAVIDLVVMQGLSQQTQTLLQPWVRAQAEAAAQLDGRFPTPHALLVVVPIGPGRSPVGFGRITRGGGASIAVLVREGARAQALLRDWVLVHEFSHLNHPFVRRDDAWLSEGLATYYQEVLRVRAGLRTAAEAFERLARGAGSARFDSGASLSSESARMYETGNFASVYWSGAAFALIADVELRRRSEGRMSLDRVLSELRGCCADALEARPARELLRRMDELSGMGVFAELARRYTRGPRLPDLGKTYEALGIDSSEQGLQMRSDAPLAWVREAIVAPHPGSTPSGGGSDLRAIHPGITPPR